MADTAALVVALSAQLTKFEKDMKQAVTIADTHTKQIENSFTKMNAQIEGQLSGFAQNAASRLGPIGAVLGGLGPIGLAVAGTLGTLAAAFLFVSEKVDQFADKARALKEFAQTVDLTTAQLKALNLIGQQVGLDSEQTEKGITKLAVAVSDLRTKGSGPLFDVLVKINPELTRQVAAAKDTAEAIDILSAAYKDLTQQQQISFSAALFGRRNLGAGRILEALPETGLTAAGQAQLDKGFSPELIERAAKLRQEIEAIKKQSDNIFGRTFALDELERQKRSAEFWRDIALFVEKAYSFVRTSTPPQPPSTADLVADLQRQIAEIKEAPTFNISSRERAERTKILTDLELKLADALKKRGAEEKKVAELEREAANVPLPPQRPITPPDTAANLQLELNLMKAWTSILGDALTQAEALRLKRLELAAAGAANRDVLPFITRAENDFILKQREAAEAIRQRLGIATEAQIFATKQARLNADVAKIGGISPEERLIATNIQLRESRDAADALLVRQAYLPGLKQLELDAANVRKGLDTLATQSLNTLTDGFADVIVGTKSLADAFKSVTESILRDLVRLALRQTITGPLAGALANAFGGGGLSSSSSVAALTGAGNPGWSDIFSRRQGGGPVSRGRGYVVGEHGMELFVPSSSGQIVPGSLQPSAGGGSEVIINNYMAAESETKQSKSEGPNGERIVIDIIKKAQSRGEFDGVNKGRFGLRPAKVR